MIDPERVDPGRTFRTPNGQRITGLRVRRGWLLVSTRSRIYRLRRGRLRLWRKR